MAERYRDRRERLGKWQMERASRRDDPRSEWWGSKGSTDPGYREDFGPEGSEDEDFREDRRRSYGVHDYEQSYGRGSGYGSGPGDRPPPRPDYDRGSGPSLRDEPRSYSRYLDWRDANLPAGGHGGPRDRDLPRRRGSEDRGMWDKATDEVASWFGDDDAERRRERDKHRGKGPKNYQRSDERIREDVCDLLTADSEVDPSDIEVTVSDREVTLTGTVASRAERRRAEDCAESIAGVTHVQNNVRVAERSDQASTPWQDATSRGASVSGGVTGQAAETSRGNGNNWRSS